MFQNKEIQAFSAYITGCLMLNRVRMLVLKVKLQPVIWLLDFSPKYTECPRPLTSQQPASAACLFLSVWLCLSILLSLPEASLWVALAVSK